jgi:hypothetical protein
MGSLDETRRFFLRIRKFLLVSAVQVRGFPSKPVGTPREQRAVMIHYVTTVKGTWADVKKAARRHVRQIGSGTATLVVQPPRLTHSEEGPWADTLLERHNRGECVVVAATSEIALLALLWHVGEGRIPSNVDTYQCQELAVYCVGERDRRGDYRLRVKADGEFLDPWPDGLFDGRMQYLF